MGYSSLFLEGEKLDGLFTPWGGGGGGGGGSCIIMGKAWGDSSLWRGEGSFLCALPLGLIPGSAYAHVQN